MDEILMNVNWLAVVVGAVVSFVGGWLWYSPILFGNSFLVNRVIGRCKSSVANAAE